MGESVKSDPYLMNLIFSLSQAVMMQLGKIANPVTGNVEKNVDQAKLSIDMLDMLKRKTAGNLTEEEEKILVETLAHLQLNYADEVKQKETPEEVKK